MKIAYLEMPVYLFEPKSRQWNQWVHEIDVRPWMPPKRFAGASRMMRWPVRRAEVWDVLNYASEVPRFRGEGTIKVDAKLEAHMQRRLRFVAHPTLIKYMRDGPMLYMRVVVNAQLAMAVAAARVEGRSAIELSEDDFPHVLVERYGRAYPLETVLSRNLMDAGSLDSQTLLVARWVEREYRKCVRGYVMSPPTLLSGHRLRRLGGEEVAADLPELGIVTGIYGATILWVLQALHNRPRIGVCVECRVPFVRARGRRRQFCGDTCRNRRFRRGRVP